MENYHYTAFISYRHKTPDELVAKKLHTLIETYKIPAKIRKSSGMKNMGRVFRDQEELPLAVDLGSDIKTALDGSEWLIVICSPDYLESKWCMMELDYFISLGRRDRILALLVNGEPAEAFPEQLCTLETENGVVRIEPLAGDVRAETPAEALKKLNREKLRILAPMLGVSFDALRQRARKRRLRTAAAACAAVVALLSGFLTYALIKNSQISLQRDLAVDNQMQTLIEQAGTNVGTGNKAPAKKLLSQAAQLKETVGEKNDAALYSALESALYTSSFEVIQTVNTDNRKLGSIVFSHNDRYLLGITNLNSAVLVDAESGEYLFTVSRSDFGQLDSVGFTKDDAYFYTVDSWYGYVSLYKTETGELYRQFDANDGNAWNIGEKAYALEGGKIVVPLRDVLCVWDYEADTGEDILPTGGTSFDSYLQPFILDISPDGMRAVVGSHGNGSGMKILSLDGKQTISLEHDGERGYFPIGFSGDGKYVAASSAANYYIWDAETGKQTLQGEVSGEAVSLPTVKLNYDGSVLIVSDAQYLAAVNARTGRLLWEKTAESNVVTETAISPNGKYVAALGGIEGVYDIETGEMLSDRPCSAFSNDGKKVLCGSYGSSPALLATPEYATAKVVDGFDGELFAAPRYTDPKKNVMLNMNHDAGYYATESGSIGRKTGVYTDAAAKYAAYTHYDGYIEVFDITDTDNVKEIYCIAEHCYYSVEDVVFSGSLMASSGGYDPRCAVFDLAAGKMVHVLRGEGYAHRAEFSPDGARLIMLCGAAKTTALVYSVQTGNLLYRIDAPEGTAIADIGFGEDGGAVIKFSDGRAAVCALYGTLDEMIEKTNE